jgi:AraC-like DNA-binding protein
MTTDRPQIAAIAVVDLARELKRHRVIGLAQIRDIDRQLADHVVALEENRDVSGLMEMRYPESWLTTLWQLADNDADHADIGARIGATVSPEARGMLANLMLHCDTLNDALETYVANIGLLNASECWQVYRNASHVELTFSFIPIGTYPRCAVERSMVALCHWARYLSGSDIAVCSVEFAFPKPAYADFLRASFQCPVLFDSCRHALVVSEDILSRPLPQRNRYMKDMLEQKISELGLLAQAKSIEKRVRELLRRDLSGYRHIDNMAQSLCMSRATLYRKLKEEGTSFTRMLDEERRDLWHRHGRKPVAALCDLLGFQDVSAYYKARKRWGESRK